MGLGGLDLWEVLRFGAVESVQHQDSDDQEADADGTGVFFTQNIGRGFDNPGCASTAASIMLGLRFVLVVARMD